MKLVFAVNSVVFRKRVCIFLYVKTSLHKTYGKPSVFLRYFDGTHLARVGRQKVPKPDLPGVRRPTKTLVFFVTLFTKPPHSASTVC